MRTRHGSAVTEVTEPTGGSVLPQCYPERSETNGVTCKSLT